MQFRRIRPQSDQLLTWLEGEVGEPLEGVWSGYTNTRDDVLLLLSASQCWVAWSRKGYERWDRSECRLVVESDRIQIESGRSKPFRLSLDSRSLLEVQSALTGEPVVVAEPARPRRSVSLARIVTLPNLPGHRIVTVHGVVTGMGSLSGWTATSKGQGAIDRAFPELLEAATRLGANAIVGLSGAPFGAAGGITNVLGGDAVGVLLMGTAVTVEPLMSSDDDSRD